ALPPRSGSTSGKQGRGLRCRPRPRSLFHRVVQSQRHFHPLPVPPDFHGHLIAHIQLPPDAQQLLTGFHRPAAGGEDEVPLPDARQVCGGAGHDLQHLQAPDVVLQPGARLEHRHAEGGLRPDLSIGQQVVHQPPDGGGGNGEAQTLHI
ncbi:Bacterial bifunctional deaminase-reductase C-terminal domain-containing protein, partial [Dysosmobacter welbionis]